MTLNQKRNLIDPSFVQVSQVCIQSYYDLKLHCSSHNLALRLLMYVTNMLSDSKSIHLGALILRLRDFESSVSMAITLLCS